MLGGWHWSLKWFRSRYPLHAVRGNRETAGPGQRVRRLRGPCPEAAGMLALAERPRLTWSRGRFVVLGAVIVLMPRAFRHRKMGQTGSPGWKGLSETYSCSTPDSPGHQGKRRIKYPQLTPVEAARITQLLADSRDSP